MLVKFRVLSLDETSRTMRVRYYSDEVTEADFAAHPKWPPIEFDIEIPSPTPTGAAIKNYLFTHAPRARLTKLGEIINDPSAGDLSLIANAVGQEFSEDPPEPVP